MAQAAKTQPTRTRAKKATQAAKETTQRAADTTQAAADTTQSAKQTVRQAERTVAGLVTDGLYAALGIGDTAVAALKGVPDQVERLRKATPRTVESRARDVETRVRSLWTDTPEELRTRLEAARGSAESEFVAYAQRGRSVVASITRNQATRRAVEQTRTARSQVKAAATSVRKAFGDSAEAVETAADEIGSGQTAG